MTNGELKGYVDCMVDAMLSKSSDEDQFLSAEDQLDLMWGIVRRFTKKENSVYLAIKDYDAMLSPFGEELVERTIPEWAWKSIQTRAQQILDYIKDTNYKIAPVVKAHLEKIVGGEIPYGFTFANKE